MFAPNPQRTRSSYSVSRLINRSLRLLLTLSLIAGTLAAQIEMTRRCLNRTNPLTANSQAAKRMRTELCSLPANFYASLLSHKALK